MAQEILIPGQLESIFLGIHRGINLVRIGFVLMLGVTLLLLLANLWLAWRLADLTERRPVMVIPGAAAGVYSPGIAQENLRNVARYIGSLTSNFTPATMPRRYEELRHYIAPAYLTTFDAARLKLQKEVDSQQQSRMFIPDHDVLSAPDKDEYHYQVEGKWIFLSGSLVMNTTRATLHLYFRTRDADSSNPYGVELLKIDAKVAADTQESGKTL